MNIERTRNLKLFKNEMGQANHFLITILVGLDGIKFGDVDIRDEFSTSWNPKSREQSVDRSRLFAIKSTLAWLVDNLDMYFTLTNQKPSVLQTKAYKDEIDGCGRSVYKKYLVYTRVLGIDTIEACFIDLLICWRNRLTHFNAENTMIPENRQKLLEESDHIESAFNGLLIKETLERFDNFGAPTFKEITSLIKASLNYIYLLDKYLIKCLNKTLFMNSILLNYFLGSDNKVKRLNNVYSKTDKVKRNTIENLLHYYGFNNEVDEEVDAMYESVVSLTYAEADSKLTDYSFA
ncbi:MAG: hypothetical protein K9L62_16465 [Vallitaleaceae bacterium]|nr:hypothetical protein [Vallitaleaceae bacterium]